MYVYWMHSGCHVSFMVLLGARDYLTHNTVLFGKKPVLAFSDLFDFWDWNVCCKGGFAAMQIT